MATSDFPTTSWSAIQQLKERDAPEYAQRLEALVQLYWKPIYCVIRYSWNKSAEDAKDLTQDFLLDEVIDGRLVLKARSERGSFRNFLMGAVRNFIRQSRRSADTQKRGGKLRFLSLDEEDDESAALVEGARLSDPDDVFDTAWKGLVLTRALAVAESRSRAEGREAAFAVFKRYNLEPDGRSPSYKEVGRSAGFSEAQVKHALTYGRSAFRDAVTEIVREYVDGRDELTRELKRLFGG